MLTPSVEVSIALHFLAKASRQWVISLAVYWVPADLVRSRSRRDITSDGTLAECFWLAKN